MIQVNVLHGGKLGAQLTVAANAERGDETIVTYMPLSHFDGTAKMTVRTYKNADETMFLNTLLKDLEALTDL